MKILAIETSCDETAASIIEEVGDQPTLLKNVVYSQIAEHAKTGGVIPEQASRLHLETLPVVLNEVTENGQIAYDAVACTVGPGLIGSLLLGVMSAKTIAKFRKIPFYGINHLEGHIYSSLLSETPIEFPALVLIISGGHSDIILMRNHLDYETIGYTRDDAAGEAFDKVARVLSLPYPGGPHLAKMAVNGDENAYNFPITLKGEDTCDLSFSGLKAAVALKVRSLGDNLEDQTKADIAASFQATVAKTIGQKMLLALSRHPEIKTVTLVGGVSANTYLRTYLGGLLKQHHGEINFIVPPFEYCTDNAAMIAMAGYYRYKFGEPTPLDQITVNPNLGL